MNKSESKPAVETLGARLDAILAPFAEDEQRLEASISELEAKIVEINAEIEGSRTDLSVVKSSKVESLREAAKSDPLLSVAFMGLVAGESDVAADATDAEGSEVVSGGHSLLQM